MSQLHVPAADDAALLAAAKAGDTTALGDLMARFRNYLLSVAEAEINPLVRPKVPPSDLVQDTFLEAYTLFERFDGAGADDFLRWLRGILHNKTREATARFLGTEKRDAGREVDLSSAFGVDGGPSPSTDAVRQEQARLVLAAVNRLPADYRQVIEWRNWEQLSFADIGARLGRTEDAARMLFARALKRLEEEMADGPGPLTADSA